MEIEKLLKNINLVWQKPGKNKQTQLGNCIVLETFISLSADGDTKKLDQWEICKRWQSLRVSSAV